MLRPIVLGEVVVKLLTKLCIARLLRYWPAPACCLGSVRSRGVADAAYLVTSAIQEAVVVAAPVVVVKLDISGAYDSLKSPGCCRLVGAALGGPHGQISQASRVRVDAQQSYFSHVATGMGAVAGDRYPAGGHSLARLVQLSCC